MVGENEALYATTELYRWGEKNHRCRLLIFYNAERAASGFFCILSNTIKSPAEALSIYRNKDVVENCFDDLKNHLDMKRLRVHSSQNMDSRLFLQFLALIYVSSIRATIQDDPKLKLFTVAKVMVEIETLVKIKYSGRYGSVSTETAPVQRRIMELFGIALPA